MVKTIKLLVAALIAAFALSSCSVILPVNATANPIGSKVGKSSATGFFGIFFFDQDASIMTAARNAGIRQISTVDIRVSTVLGIVNTYETIVTGD